MPEIRQNIATKEWVILSTERAKRPNAFVESAQHPMTSELPPHDPGCPFCPGNEERDLEVASLPSPDHWQTRIVRNRYPALLEDGELTQSLQGMHRWINGVGYHDVVVDHPQHNTTLALMAPHEVQAALETMQYRGRIISADPQIQQIIYFKNHGRRAGASLSHPHTQIIALPMVPTDVVRRMREARHHFEETGGCVFCRITADELEARSRIVVESTHFIAFTLYAALSPFHLWIIPRRHISDFLATSPEETADLGYVLQEVMRRIYRSLRDIDYNLIFRTPPVREAITPYFHWYISVVPRINYIAGFELTTGMAINPTLPEECAAFLREQ